MKKKKIIVENGAISIRQEKKFVKCRGPNSQRYLGLPLLSGQLFGPDSTKTKANWVVFELTRKKALQVLFGRKDNGSAGDLCVKEWLIMERMEPDSVVLREKAATTG
jgi:hypothetical protein